MTIHFNANLRPLLGEHVGMLHWVMDPEVSGFIIGYDLSDNQVLICNFDVQPPSITLSHVNSTNIQNLSPVQETPCRFMGRDTLPKNLNRRNRSIYPFRCPEFPTLDFQQESCKKLWDWKCIPVSANDFIVRPIQRVP